jgi:RNA polymerase sigma-70 factor (ECF subfamily)
VVVVHFGVRVDRDELKIVYEKYHMKVLSVVVHLTGNLEEAEEIMQDTFIKYFNCEQRPTRADESYLKAWLFRVAINRSKDRFRKIKRFFSDGFIEVEGVSNINEFEIKKDLQTLLLKLNQKERTVIVLKHVAGMSYIEISKLLSINEGSIKSLVFRGMQKLNGDKI